MLGIIIISDTRVKMNVVIAVFFSCALFDHFDRTLTLDSDFLKDYDSKVCKNEQSCHLVSQQNLPKTRRTLEGRDCMCDFECVEYNDCCQDSEFYGAYPPVAPKIYHCSTNGQVYVLATCPSEYTDQSVIQKCLASTEPLQGDDISVIRPATNIQHRITYGNAYCALCNNDLDIVLWNLTSGCGEAPIGYFSSSSNYQPQSPTAKTKTDEPNYETPEENEVSTPPNKYPNKNSKPAPGFFPIQLIPNFSPSKITTSYGGFNVRFGRNRRQAQLQIDFNKHAKDLDNILKNVRYDPQTSQYVSQYNNKNFICQFGTQLPRNSELYVRKCVTDLISSCPSIAKKEISDRCQEYTAVVYETANKQAYKNRDCAKCNGVAETSLTGCPPQAVRTASSSLFSTADKSTGAPCDNPALRAKFCS